MSAQPPQGRQPIPPKIDQALLSLCGNREVGRVLGARVVSIARSVFRSFAEEPADRAEIQRALEKIQRCFEVMALEGGGPPTVQADLGQLAARLQEMLHEPAGLPADRPPPVYSPPARPPRPAAAPPVYRSPPPAPAPERRTPAPERRAPVQRPRRSDKVAREVLHQLADMVEHRTRLLGEPLASLGALAIVDDRIGNALASAGFIAGDIQPPARAALAQAEEDHQRTAAALVLLRCGDQDLVLADLAARPTAPGGDHAVGLALALRYHDDPAFTARLEQALPGAAGAARASLMTALAVRGRITPDALIAMLDDVVPPATGSCSRRGCARARRARGTIPSCTRRSRLDRRRRCWRRAAWSKPVNRSRPRPSTCWRSRATRATARGCWRWRPATKRWRRGRCRPRGIWAARRPPPRLRPARSLSTTR